MKIKHRVNTFRMLALRHVTFCLQAGNLLFHSDILQQCILHGNFTRHVEHDGLQTKTFPSQESFRVQNYLLGFLLLSSTISSSLKNHHFGTWMCFPTFQQKTNHHPPPHPPFKLTPQTKILSLSERAELWLGKSNVPSASGRKIPINSTWSLHALDLPSERRTTCGSSNIKPGKKDGLNCWNNVFFFSRSWSKPSWNIDITKLFWKKQIDII